MTEHYFTADVIPTVGYGVKWGLIIGISMGAAIFWKMRKAVKRLKDDNQR